VGKVTTALRALSVGQAVGFRGPYGNHFAVERWRGRDLSFVGGGIGMAALRAPLCFVLDHREDYGEILVLNGARTVGDIVYAEEMNEWVRADGARVVRTVDPGGETPDWNGEVGLVPDVFERLGSKPNGGVVITCGPPVMLRFMLAALERMGYEPDRVVTTLENKMKCGLGLCGRCSVGRFVVCRDGPVITAARLGTLPADY
jgi:NAD(P)H-flavin reductase